MAAKSPDERLDRLERVVHILAEDQQALQQLIAELARETNKGFAKVAEQMAETDRRFRETDQRFRDTDQRIDRLVIAIGEFVSRQPPA